MEHFFLNFRHYFFIGLKSENFHGQINDFISLPKQKVLISFALRKDALKSKEIFQQWNEEIIQDLNVHIRGNYYYLNLSFKADLTYR